MGKDIERQKRRLVELHIDRAYVNSPVVDDVIAAGGTVFAKPWAQRPHRPGLFSKKDFTIDLRTKTITCPAGEVEPFAPGATVQFDPEACGACKLRSKCRQAASGRTVSIALDESRQRKFRQLQQSKFGRASLRERTAVEHALAHIAARKGDHARYRGVRKKSSTCGDDSNPRRRASPESRGSGTYGSHACLNLFGALGRRGGTQAPACERERGSSSSLARLNACSTRRRSLMSVSTIKSSHRPARAGSPGMRARLVVTQGAARCRHLLKHSIERIDGSPTILLRGGAGRRHPVDERPVSLLDLLLRVVESAGARPEGPGAAQRSPIVVVKPSSVGGLGDRRRPGRLCCLGRRWRRCAPFHRRRRRAPFPPHPGPPAAPLLEWAPAPPRRRRRT
jgi:hypothetical protein